MKNYIYLLLMLLPNMSFGETIFTCDEIKSTNISWSLDKNGSKPTAEATNKLESPMSIVFVEKKDEASVKGNADQVQLKKISTNTFLETTPSGNVNTWTLLKGKATYLFLFKAYKLSEPFSLTSLFQCK
jgi:hypothetical protein